MKTTGQILQTFSSMFRSSESRRKRANLRKREFSALESLEQRALLTVPALASNPGGQMVIYLDFDGESYANREIYITDRVGNTVQFLQNMSVIPGFTLDATPGPDSAIEERMIEEVFYRVAEDFKPFNVNVTTIRPAPSIPQIHVSIGGTGTVQAEVVTRVFTNAGGFDDNFGPRQSYLFTSPTFALRGAYTTRPANPVLVFPAQLPTEEQNGLNIARLVSRGAGQQLGLLEHQAQGDEDFGPLLGNPTQTTLRDTFTVTTIPAQDEISVMTGNGAFANAGFRLRNDDIGDNVATAVAAQNVLVSSAALTSVDLGGGLINANASRAQLDTDYFRTILDFRGTTGTGELTLDVSGIDLSTHTFLDGATDGTLNPGSNLDPVLNLRDANGVLITNNVTVVSVGGRDQLVYRIPASSIPSNRILTLYIEVTTTSVVGSLGEYLISGSLQQVLGAPTVLTPSGTITTVIPSFGWTASREATSYILEVSNATTGNVIFTKTTTATAYTINPEDPNVLPQPVNSLPEGSYRARVKAIRGAGGLNNESPFGPYRNFVINIPAPSRPIITAPKGEIGTSFPTFSWSRGGFDASYNIVVNRIGTTTTRVINKTANIGNTYTHFSALPDGNYSFAVRAFNAVNEPGALSEFVAFTVDSPVPASPRLTAPVNTVTVTNPRFTWTAVAGVARYDLWVNNLSAGTSQFIREQNLPHNRTFFDPAVLPQGNYSAFIRAINGNGEASPWSARLNFTVNILPPIAPSMTGPRGAGDSSTITTTNPTFTWTAVARATRYDLLVNNLSTNTTQIIRQTALTTTSFTSLTNLPQGRYRSWVRGINVANEVGDWSLPLDFIIDEPTPSTPVINAPVPTTVGFVEDANPTFVWSLTPAAPKYDFHLYNVSQRSTAINVKGLTSTQYRIPDNKRLGEFTYMARVRAVNNSGDTSDWSPWYQIRINVPDTTTPILISPGDTISDRTPTFTWVHTATSFRYELLLRDLGNGDSITLQVSSFGLGPNGTTAVYTLPNANALRPGTYRFWVRAFNSQNQASAWSTSKTFAVSAQLDPAVSAPEGLLIIASEMLVALTDESGSTNSRRDTAVPVMAVRDVTGADEDAQPEAIYSSFDLPAMNLSGQRQLVEVASTSDEESLIDLVMQRVADPAGGLAESDFRS